MHALAISEFANYIAGSEIAADKIWEKPLDAISGMDIQLFYARSQISGNMAIAKRAIDALQSELLVLAARGRISGKFLRIVEHEVPSERFTADEFMFRLGNVSGSRIQAILFALATRTSPNTVAGMEWATLTAQGFAPGLPHEIMTKRAKLRHLRLPYVFWEFATEKIATPLLKLQESAEDAFNASWPAIQEIWGEVIWISPRADAHNLLAVVAEVQGGRL